MIWFYSQNQKRSSDFFRNVMSCRIELCEKARKNDNKNGIWNGHALSSSYAILFFRDIYWISLISLVNLTLACSQSDFVRNHVNIIPASVKDVFEKSSDEVPDRTAMKLYRSNHTVIGCRHLSTSITTIMKWIVALSSQLSNGSLSQVVVYW